MELKDLILDLIAQKLKREKHMDLVVEDFAGKRPDAVLKSSGSTLGLLLAVFDESEDEVAERVEEFRGLGAPVYLLVQKGRQKAITNMLFKRSLFDVKVVTWDIQVGL